VSPAVRPDRRRLRRRRTPGVFGGTRCRRCDRDDTIVLLQEEQARHFHFAPDLTRLLHTLVLAAPADDPVASQTALRGDGLLLLHHGHVLIAKERNTPVPDRIRMRDLAAMMTRRSLGPGGIDRSLSRGRRTSGRRCPCHAPRSTTRASPACPAPPDAAASRNCETRATLSTTRHHRNDVGAARGVAARQGHRRDPADHRRPPQGQTAASTHSAPTHRSLRAYSSASRPANPAQRHRRLADHRHHTRRPRARPEGLNSSPRSSHHRHRHQTCRTISSCRHSTAGDSTGWRRPGAFGC